MCCRWVMSPDHWETRAFWETFGCICSPTWPQMSVLLEDGWGSPLCDTISALECTQRCSRERRNQKTLVTDYGTVGKGNENGVGKRDRGWELTSDSQIASPISPTWPPLDWVYALKPFERPVNMGRPSLFALATWLNTLQSPSACADSFGSCKVRQKGHYSCRLSHRSQLPYHTWTLSLSWPPHLGTKHWKAYPSAYSTRKQPSRPSRQATWTPFWWPDKSRLSWGRGEWQYRWREHHRALGPACYLLVLIDNHQAKSRVPRSSAHSYLFHVLLAPFFRLQSGAYSWTGETSSRIACCPHRRWQGRPWECRLQTNESWPASFEVSIHFLTVPWFSLTFATVSSRTLRSWPEYIRGSYKRIT